MIFCYPYPNSYHTTGHQKEISLIKKWVLGYWKLYLNVLMCNSKMNNRLPKWDYMVIPVKIFRHRKYFENYKNIYLFRSFNLDWLQDLFLIPAFSCYLSLRTSGSSFCAEPTPTLLDGWWEETWVAKVGHKESIQKKVAFISLLHIVEWVFIIFFLWHLSST